MFSRTSRAATKAPAQNAHREHELHCTSLCCAKSGQRLCVTQLCGGESESCKLRELGVREGANLTVLRHGTGGNPILIRIDGARFGIGQGAATNVLCDVVTADAL